MGACPSLQKAFDARPSKAHHNSKRTSQQKRTSEKHNKHIISSGIPDNKISALTIHEDAVLEALCEITNIEADSTRINRNMKVSAKGKLLHSRSMSMLG